MGTERTLKLVSSRDDRTPGGKSANPISPLIFELLGDIVSDRRYIARPSMSPVNRPFTSKLAS